MIKVELWWVLRLGCNMKQIIKKYLDDKSGQFSIWIGVAALPMLAAVSFAVDSSGAERGRAELKAALDSASLAAVTNQTLTVAERDAYARSFFESNFSRHKDFTLTVKESVDTRVELFATGTSAVTVSRAVGVKGIDIAERSVAVLTKEDTICVLTLNPDGAGSFSVVDGSSFSSPTCSVQVNSNNKAAAVTDNKSEAYAKSFCVSGGATGKFEPFINTECSGVKDPYVDLTPPTPGACIYDQKLEFKIEQTLDESKFGNLFVDELVSVVGDMITLTPGTYCQKLKVEGYNVTFLPGTYIMNNAELEFKAGASAYADDVTFVLHGKKSKMKVEGGSQLYIKAPSTGDLAGLAVYQNPAVALIEADGKTKKNAKFPSAKSELKGGATMNILGAVYLPTQELKVGSNSGLGTVAPATSFIAYDVHFEGGAEIVIAVENEAAGLPETLLKSDSSARLAE